MATPHAAKTYASKLANALVWSPPPGWIPHAPGVWIPSDWKPTRWELPSPVVRNFEDAKADYAKCARSLPYFVFRHCWTVDVDDPGGGISERKFPAYPFLRKFFSEVQTPSNTHVEKSRQMLMSWGWMAVFVWDVLFNRNWPALVLSKRAIDVDNGTIDSNFGKFRFIADHLPEHLWTYIEYKQFSIKVPATKSHVRGETGKGGKASRGPTYKRALMDEAAYVEKSESVFTGLRQAAKTGTILNSTPEGMGNTFARIRFSSTTTFKKLSFHWSEHPRKAIGLYCICGWKATSGVGLSPRDQFLQVHAKECPRLALTPPRSPEMRSPWYDRECSDMTPEKVASDLDISYAASRRGRVYTAFDQIRNVYQIFHTLGPRGTDETAEDYRFRYLRRVIEPHKQCFTAWDIGVGDPTALLFGQILDETGPVVRFLDEIEFTDKSYDFYGSIVNDVWKVAATSVGNAINFRHYGGVDTKNRDSKLESWFSNLTTMGIHVETEFLGSLLEWVDFINSMYAAGRIEISEWCSHLIDATNNYHFPVDENGDPLPGQNLPVHDQWSHAMDAKRHLYRVRYQGRLHDRARKGVSTKKILARGNAYDPRAEHRKF
jgi:hypothetical protein